MASDDRTVTLAQVSIDTTVRAQLDQLKVPYEIFPCDPALADTANFCAAYDFNPEDSANTILVIGKSDPPVYAACVVLATSRLDVNKTVGISPPPLPEIVLANRRRRAEAILDYLPGSAG